MTENITSNGLSGKIKDVKPPLLVDTSSLLVLAKPVRKIAPEFIDRSRPDKLQPRTLIPALIGIAREHGFPVRIPETIMYEAIGHILTRVGEREAIKEGRPNIPHKRYEDFETLKLMFGGVVMGKHPGIRVMGQKGHLGMGDEEYQKRVISEVPNWGEDHLIRLMKSNAANYVVGLIDDGDASDRFLHAAVAAGKDATVITAFGFIQALATSGYITALGFAQEVQLDRRTVSSKENPDAYARELALRILSYAHADGRTYETDPIDRSVLKEGGNVDGVFSGLLYTAEAARQSRIEIEAKIEEERKEKDTKVPGYILKNMPHSCHAERLGDNITIRYLNEDRTEAAAFLTRRYRGVNSDPEFKDFIIEKMKLLAAEIETFERGRAEEYALAKSNLKRKGFEIKNEPSSTATIEHSTYGISIPLDLSSTANEGMANDVVFKTMKVAIDEAEIVYKRRRALIDALELEPINAAVEISNKNNALTIMYGRESLEVVVPLSPAGTTTDESLAAIFDVAADARTEKIGVGKNVLRFSEVSANLSTKHQGPTVTLNTYTELAEKLLAAIDGLKGNTAKGEKRPGKQTLSRLLKEGAAEVETLFARLDPDANVSGLTSQLRELAAALEEHARLEMRSGLNKQGRDRMVELNKVIEKKSALLTYEGVSETLLLPVIASILTHSPIAEAIGISNDAAPLTRVAEGFDKRITQEAEKARTAEAPVEDAPKPELSLAEQREKATKYLADFKKAQGQIQAVATSIRTSPKKPALLYDNTRITALSSLHGLLGLPMVDGEARSKAEGMLNVMEDISKVALGVKYVTNKSDLRAKQNQLIAAAGKLDANTLVRLILGTNVGVTTTSDPLSSPISPEKFDRPSGTEESTASIVR